MERQTDMHSSGARRVGKLNPEALRAVSSWERLIRWNKRRDAMRAEIGIAIGKMKGN